MGGANESFCPIAELIVWRSLAEWLVFPGVKGGDITTTIESQA
jgi:hypothetical protein